MSEQNSELMVVKISTALSNKPLFVKIHDQNMSIDHIFTQAIDELKTAGKPLESQQLADLFKAHQIFNNGKVHTKGTLFSELDSKHQAVGSSRVQLAEIDLISSHRGGAYTQLDNNFSFFITEHRLTIFDNEMNPIIEGESYESILFIKAVCDSKKLLLQTKWKVIGLICRLKESGEL